MGILVKKNVDFEAQKVNRDDAGRYIIMQFKHQGVEFVLINIYAPNDDQPAFFVEIFKKLENFNGHRIVVGDLNLALNKELDRNLPTSKNNDNAVEVLSKYQEETMLIDIWHDRNENKKQYSFIASIKNKHIMSVLDYCLVDCSISSWVENVKYILAFKSDHSAISMELLPFEVKKKWSLWKLNTTVVEEIDYVHIMNKEIRE